MAIEVTARILPRLVDEFDRMVEPIKHRHPGSGRNLKWVLIALADHSNKEGYCWPSIGTLEAYSGLTERSVQRALKQAEVIGLLKVRRRTNASSQYLLNLAMLPYVDRPTGLKERGPHVEVQAWDELDLFEEGRHDGTPASDDIDPRHTGTPPPPATTSTPASLAPKPSIEPPLEPSGEPSGAIAPVDDGTLYGFIRSEWAKLQTEFPEIGGLRQLTEQMKELVRQRTKEHRAGESDRALWTAVFSEIRQSRFLTGRAPPGPNRTTRFRLTLSTLLKPHIFREVINAKYRDSRADDGAFDPSTGEVLGPAAAATRHTIQRLRNARQPSGSGGHPRQAGCAG